jgi:hypothetical protein
MFFLHVPPPSKINRNFYGAVVPENTHLEPTLGQIWPR